MKFLSFAVILTVCTTCACAAYPLFPKSFVANLYSTTPGVMIFNFQWDGERPIVAFTLSDGNGAHADNIREIYDYANRIYVSQNVDNCCWDELSDNTKFTPFWTPIGDVKGITTCSKVDTTPVRCYNGTVYQGADPETLCFANVNGADLPHCMLSQGSVYYFVGFEAKKPAAFNFQYDLLQCSGKCKHSKRSATPF